MKTHAHEIPEPEALCSVCARGFRLTPDAVVELQWSHEAFPAEDGTEDGIDQDDLAGASVEQLREWGLTPEQRDALLSGETITAAALVCGACHESFYDTQPGGLA